MEVSEPDDDVPQPHSMTEVKVKPATPPPEAMETSEPTVGHASIPKSVDDPPPCDADAMDVDRASSDDEPLASAMLSPLTSLDDEPLTAMVDATSSDDKPLSMVDKDYESSDEPLAAMELSPDEEPLSGFIPSHARTETAGESVPRLDSQMKLTNLNQLRIRIPPPLKPPSQTIRRVRLILGPKPATPQSSSSSSSRESSPERSSASPRRRYSGWFSDESELTPLESSMDEGESEVDPHESDHEPSVPTATIVNSTTPSRRKKGSRPVKHRLQCATDDCVNLLPPDWKWRFCNTCRSQHKVFHREQALLQRLEQGNTHGLAISAGADLTGYRKCSSNRCKCLVPPIEQYQYKRCPRCRGYARRRAHVLRHGVTPDELSKDPGLSFSNARASAFVTLDTMIHSSKSRPPGPTGFAHTDGKLVDLPPFQHFPALLCAFRTRFDTFRTAQARYVQLKALQGAEPQSMVFTFDGEYSIIADPTGGAVDPIVNTAIHNFTSALGLVFVPVGVLSGPEESIIAELKCVYAAQFPALRTKTADAVPEADAQQLSASPTTPAPNEVAMAGELQICVAWDRRHRLFAGRRSWCVSDSLADPSSPSPSMYTILYHPSEFLRIVRASIVPLHVYQCNGLR
ncbi:hypothetical protein C8Q80DRAFT_200305 [Daedaleopsis nitida]|nr:hypothetical protein C8Q80DRAFT_200305 [Daedaleopsis nitida]